MFLFSFWEVLGRSIVKINTQLILQMLSLKECFSSYIIGTMFLYIKQQFLLSCSFFIFMRNATKIQLLFEEVKTGLSLNNLITYTRKWISIIQQTKSLLCLILFSSIPSITLLLWNCTMEWAQCSYLIVMVAKVISQKADYDLHSSSHQELSSTSKMELSDKNGRKEVKHYILKSDSIPLAMHTPNNLTESKYKEMLCKTYNRL